MGALGGAMNNMAQQQAPTGSQSAQQDAPVPQSSGKRMKGPRVNADDIMGKKEN
jgi:hypothetical protein